MAFKNDNLNKGNENNDNKSMVPSGGNQVAGRSGGGNDNGGDDGGKQALGKIQLAKIPANAVSTDVKKPTDGGRINGIDTGLACLIAIAKYYNIPAEYRQLERAYVHPRPCCS